MDYPVLCLRNDSLLKSLAQNIVTLMCFFNNICFQSCLGQTCTPLISGGKFFFKKLCTKFLGTLVAQWPENIMHHIYSLSAVAFHS